MGNDQKNNYAYYAAFKSKQLALAELLDQSAEVISEMNMGQAQESLVRLSGKVHNETFRIMVVGTFKNGKSTFINSFLGENVLPAYAIPCTAVINEVKWGTEKRAVIHFRDPLPEKLPADLPARAIAHMDRFGRKKVPPLEISYEDIQEYAVIPFGKDPKEMLLESPYEKIELFWPLELLRSGVEIIDSPGLNEHETRTRVTMEYLARADAILFVLNATQLCSMEEMRFIQNNLVTQGFEDPFFIVNRFDLIPREQRGMVQKFAQAKLGDLSSNEIYYVSAQDALDGKVHGDAAKYAGSGMKALEDRLSVFLTREKGRAKLAQPARELNHILTEEALYKVLPMQRQVLGTALDDVKARYETIRPQIVQLRAEKEQLHSRMLLRVEQSKSAFRSAALRNLANIAASIPAWVNAYQPTVKFGLIPNKDKSEQIFNEIVAHVSDKVEEEQLEWRVKVLEPAIAERAEEILSSVEPDLCRILSSVDQVNRDFSGGAEKVELVDVWGRIGGGSDAGGGDALGLGSKVKIIAGAFAKTYALTFAGSAILAVLSWLNPVTAFLAVGTIIMGNWMSAKEKAMNKLKEAVIQVYRDKLSENAEQVAGEMTEGISKGLAAVCERVVDAVDSEIQSTQEQMDGIIAEMEKGQENIDQRKAALDEHEKTIRMLISELNDFIFQLMN